jgi:hypothetical protein
MLAPKTPVSTGAPSDRSSWQNRSLRLKRVARRLTVKLASLA